MCKLPIFHKPQHTQIYFPKYRKGEKATMTSHHPQKPIEKPQTHRLRNYEITKEIWQNVTLISLHYSQKKNSFGAINSDINFVLAEIKAHKYISHP